MKNKNTSLANRYIQYAMSTAASNERNHQMASLSQEQFTATLPEDRDIAWLGHCINRCPGYKIEADMAEAVTDVFRNNYSTDKKAKQFNSRLERNPKTYATPFPVMWLEWEGGKEGEEPLHNGILVENLDAGIRVTFFSLNPKSGVWPTIYTPISIASGTPKDMHTSRAYPKDTPAHLNAAFIEERDSQSLQQMMQETYIMALCALTVLNSRKDIKLVPATEFVNQQTTIEGEHAETPNTMIKPIGLLTFKRPEGLKFQTGNIIELMRQEQQELASMMGARKSSDTAPAITSNVKPSKPRLLKRVKDVFARSQETSLASQFIRYGISTGSEMRNNELSLLSVKELLEVPQGERDHAWFAHCIEKSTGYAGDRNIIDAIAKFQTETYSEDGVTERVYQILSKQPELYTPPVPVLWMEFEYDSGDFLKVAYLLTRLPGNKPGLQITPFFLSNDHEVMPQKGHHIVHSITESTGDDIGTTFYSDNMSFQPESESDLYFFKETGNLLHLMLALNDPSQPLKLTPPLTASLERQIP